MRRAMGVVVVGGGRRLGEVLDRELHHRAAGRTRAEADEPAMPRRVGRPGRAAGGGQSAFAALNLTLSGVELGIRDALCSKDAVDDVSYSGLGLRAEPRGPQHYLL